MPEALVCLASGTCLCTTSSREDKGCSALALYRPAGHHAGEGVGGVLNESQGIRDSLRAMGPRLA